MTSPPRTRDPQRSKELLHLDRQGYLWSDDSRRSKQGIQPRACFTRR
jgi:hypothetical protein